MARERVMSPDEWNDFKSFLREGLEQYETTPMRAGQRYKRKPSAQDLELERLGLQKRWSPLAEAGYTTSAQVGKLIENALARRLNEKRAALAIYALEMSAAAVRWRQSQPGGFDDDRWYWRLQDLRAQEVCWSALPLSPKPPMDELVTAGVMMVPGAESVVAAAVVRDLFDRKLLSKPKMAEAHRVVSEGIKRRRDPWKRAFLNWVNLGDVLRRVRVVLIEGCTLTGVPFVRRRLYTEDKLGSVISSDDGAREPSHAEFLEAVYDYVSARKGGRG